MTSSGLSQVGTHYKCRGACCSVVGTLYSTAAAAALPNAMAPNAFGAHSLSFCIILSLLSLSLTLSLAIMSI